MDRRIAAAMVSSLALGSSGCVLGVYDWDADRQSRDGASGIDASFADGPAALQGTIRYPVRTGRSGGGAPLDPIAGVLRITVYPIINDADATSLDAIGFDTVSLDAIGPDAFSPECHAPWGQPPTYSVSMYPAPDPAFYHFDNVPTGNYCVFVVLDMPPFAAVGDPPGCEDLRASAPYVTVIAPLTTAPDLFLDYPPHCQ